VPNTCKSNGLVICRQKSDVGGIAGISRVRLRERSEELTTGS